MRRIAIITTSYPERRGDASGHFVAAEAEELALAGHDVHVVCPGEPSGQDPTSTVVVHRCGGARAFGWPGAIARLRAKPWRTLDAFRFIDRARGVLVDIDELGLDEIRTHWMIPSAWPIANVVQKPLRVMCHGGDVRTLRALPRPLRHHIVQDVVGRAERVAFAGRHLRQELLSSLDDALAARLERISAIEAPMLIVAVPDPLNRAATRRRLCAGVNTPLVAVVGRLVPSKRVDLAIRTAAATSGPMRLVIIGDGPERSALTRLARDLGVSCTFMGQRDRHDTHELMAACDVLLHTSAAEGAPSVVREARVLGIPVVATSSGDIGTWAERDSGLAVLPATASALAARVDALLSAR